MYGVVNLKRWLRVTAAAVLAVGVLGVFGALLRVFRGGKLACSLPVIMYHAVIDDSGRLRQYVISPAELESDFRWLQATATAVLSEDLLRYVEDGTPLPEKPVLITFDDGYYNNYRYAFPAAKQYGMKFVLSPIGRCADLYTEEPSESQYYAHCTWEMMREMQDSGIVEIGNHVRPAQFRRLPARHAAAFHGVDGDVP